MVTIFYWFIIAVAILLGIALVYKILYKLWNWLKEVRTKSRMRI
ncbi:MAG TPA: hypothetical protein VL633_03045 [Bacteroidota bacterium]|nr:hypothetical protein [Bacteroidota bacterium]